MSEIISDLIDDVVRTAKTLGGEEETGSSASVSDAEVNYLVTRQALDCALASLGDGGTVFSAAKPTSDRMSVGD